MMELLFRLGISYPELTEMQARAIFEAAIAMTNQGVQVHPEIMVPLVGTPQVCTLLPCLSVQFKR
jgi:phosphoenolpyruvate synthase/pyruvate phosphate dikinase